MVIEGWSAILDSLLVIIQAVVTMVTVPVAMAGHVTGKPTWPALQTCLGRAEAVYFQSTDLPSGIGNWMILLLERMSASSQVSDAQ